MAGTKTVETHGKPYWGPNSRVSEFFPRTHKAGSKVYDLSPINPTLVRNTGQERAKKDLATLKKKAGWTARIVRFDTPRGYVYLVYERRSRPVYATSASTGKRKRMG